MHYRAIVFAALIGLLAASPPSPEAIAGRGKDANAASAVLASNTQTSTVTTIGTVSNIASVAGLILTIIALFLSGKQTERLRRALSTRSLGEFPRYASDIGRLIEGTKSELLILCTIPIHAPYTDYRSWLKTKQLIENALTSVEPIKIRCVLGDVASRRELVQTQFRSEIATDKTWDTFKKIDAERKKLDTFSRLFCRGKSVQDLRPDEFLDGFERATTEVLQRVLGEPSVLVKEIKSRMSIYLWISDNREAVFAFLSVFPKFKPRGYWTSDPGLIAAFTELYNSFESEAVALSIGGNGDHQREVTLSPGLNRSQPE